MSLTGTSGPSSTYKYPHTVLRHGEINVAFDIPCLHHKLSSQFPVGSTCLEGQVPTFGAHRSCDEKTTRDGPQESNFEGCRIHRRCGEGSTTGGEERQGPHGHPPRGLRRRRCQQQETAPGSPHPRRHRTHLQFRGRTTSTTTRLRSARGRRHHRGRRSHRHLSRRPAKAASSTHQKQPPAEAERKPRSQAPTSHHASQGASDDTR
jgi:hypothetical protein